MITKYISDLLYHHECVIVPGLGGFIKACSPAQILHSTNEFFPPSATLAFNAGLSANDGLLANYIATVEKITYRDAIFQIRQWVETGIADLNRNRKVTLGGIGDIFMNSAGNMEFLPSNELNFNADSFGLIFFYAKSNKSEPYVLPDIQPLKRTIKKKTLHRLIPETLKWAAVLAPFIAFALWSTFNGKIVENYVHNYTGMYSWMRSTPGKTLPHEISVPNENLTESVHTSPQFPAALLAEEAVSFDPGLVSYTEMAKYNLIGADTLQDVEQISIDESLNYHIIGGAFREYDNALKLIAMLQKQGYPAAIIDTTSGGLYVVSMDGFSKLADAKNKLDEVKKAGFVSSWILKKNRS